MSWHTLKRIIKTVLLGLVAVLLVGQFIRPKKNHSATPAAGDITLNHPTSPEVKQLLTVACYDCHSNNTRYPWYAEIQPAGWFLASHVEDGKRHLNFSEFGNYSRKRALSKLEEIKEVVEDHEMPLESYTLIHSDAQLSDDQIELLSDWAESVRQRILANPAN